MMLFTSIFSYYNELTVFNLRNLYVINSHTNMYKELLNRTTISSAGKLNYNVPKGNNTSSRSGNNSSTSRMCFYLSHLVVQV